MEIGGEDITSDEYDRYMSRGKKRHGHSKKRRHVKKLLLVIAVLLLLAGAVSWYLPLPAISATITTPDLTSAKINLPWPSYGEAAVGATGYGVLETNGQQIMLPTASVAKLITALAVLKEYPLALGQQGPTITLGPADVASYNHYLSVDGSVIKVVDGEQITEYQAIEAMLLPSANNMADSLATWAFGSLPNYVSSANQLLKSLGLAQTVVADDASGFLPNTKSTASDLVELGQATLANPVLQQVVGEKQANLPEAGTVNNVNWLLGQNGVIGIKTGNTTQAGGVYLFASKYAVSSEYSVTIIGAIMGAPTLQAALNSSVPLLQDTVNNFQVKNIIASGEIVGYYTAPWNNVRVDAAASQNVAVPIWNGLGPKPQAALNAIYSPINGGSRVGYVSTSFNGSTYSSPVTLSRSIGNPPWYWRILRHKLHF